MVKITIIERFSNHFVQLVIVLAKYLKIGENFNNKQIAVLYLSIQTLTAINQIFFSSDDAEMIYYNNPL
jgi:hypothetical protein